MVRAILLTCPAFHAEGTIDNLHHLSIGCKYTMGTDNAAHLASIAKFPFKNQGIFLISIQHYLLTVDETIMAVEKKNIPAANNHTMAGK